ncbi:helix-turn-helix domain-containing protein [Dyadobacter pollutisoli]|uniref:Helix-turn-helix transcriptional regulator n=1 Tax=Dyadobacter pollutisoli TaxID=2910158 RepID=A0A9E8NAK9_9BACT|nr:helix-turn-helix transcriptional regulator [Dyadobacter pollutisoli]WAC13084.1 helix-turn-helix transcriptional regulator [Dyadobacter pollutisoli]
MKSNDFKAFQIESLCNYVPSFGRKDLYRICLVTGESRVYFADKCVNLSGTCLFFGNINTPYSWEIVSDTQNGYGCLFTEDFLKGAEYFDNIGSLSVFNIGNLPVYELQDQTQIANVNFIFKRILEENGGDYVKRQEMIRSFICILVHEALKSRAVAGYSERTAHKTASLRISTLFLRMLDTQFPVENKRKSIQFTKPTDFAGRLGVHPNYLNRMLKKETGKTILKIINERIITEARILLQHTDWSISEIAHCLGFEYHSHFDGLFKKITGLSPRIYREMV